MALIEGLENVPLLSLSIHHLDNCQWSLYFLHQSRLLSRQSPLTAKYEWQVALKINASGILLYDWKTGNSTPPVSTWSTVQCQSRKTYCY